MRLTQEVCQESFPPVILWEGGAKATVLPGAGPSAWCTHTQAPWRASRRGNASCMSFRLFQPPKRLPSALTLPLSHVGEQAWLPGQASGGGL